MVIAIAFRLGFDRCFRLGFTSLFSGGDLALLCGFFDDYVGESGEHALFSGFGEGSVASGGGEGGVAAGVLVLFPRMDNGR